MNCFILGPARSGSAFLNYLLAQHPEISSRTIKEPNFFNLDSNFNQGNKFYSTFFDNNNLLRVDASHRYFYLPYVAERIFKFNKKAKFIIILRNPIERCVSHYYYYYSRNIETLSFENAIKHDLNRILHGPYFDSYQKYHNYKINFKCKPNEDYFRTYVDSGLIYNQLMNFTRFFDISSFHFVNFDNMINNPIQILNGVTNFLNISDYPNYKLPHTNNESRNIYIARFIQYAISCDMRFKKYTPQFIKKLFIAILSSLSRNLLPNPTKKIILENMSLIKRIKSIYRKDISLLKKNFDININF